MISVSGADFETNAPNSVVVSELHFAVWLIINNSNNILTVLYISWLLIWIVDH